MKRAFILLLFLAPLVTKAQYSRKGLYAGIGVGEFYYKTHWYYHNESGSPYYDNYPGHTTDRATLILSLEKKSIFNIKTIYYDADKPEQKMYVDFDLGGELQLGTIGKTTADWIADDPVISNGGGAVGINTYIRGGFVLPNSHDKNKNLVAYLALGPGVTMIHYNGKGVDAIAARPGYNYTDGWNEYLFMLNTAIGLKFEFGSFDITPEARFTFPGAATSTTSWEPNGNVVSESAPLMYGFSIKFSKRLGGSGKK